MVEFFLGFLELIGEDLLQVIKESCSEGYIHPPINATFIALIPKSNNLGSLDEYRHISLCNYLYKIISKVITRQLKDILSNRISGEQFGFLAGIQIHEAIGVAQEGLHSLKSRRLKGVVIKLDLSKAYDRVNWIYLRLLLTHLGFAVSFIRWVMSCVTSISFVVLINGATSPFFSLRRGLHQGCPLSPLLFLLVVESLSHFLDHAKITSSYKGVPISQVFSSPIFCLLMIF